MPTTLDDVAARLYRMSDGLRVDRVSVEHQVGKDEITEHVPPEGDIPRHDGAFRIIIEVAATIVRRKAVA